MKQKKVITKAVIPIAGLGTRMGPICRALPKAMFPLVDHKRQSIRPVVHQVCMAASGAGIDQVAVIAGARDLDMLHRYFAAAHEAFPAELPVNVEFIAQGQPRGLGDAVLLAEHFVGAEPFMLLLGDHLYVADARARPCGAQVVDAFIQQPGAAMVGMQVVGPEELPRVGAARGLPVKDNVYLCTELIEKPDAATARQRLSTPGLPPDRFLAHAGIYILTPEIFDCIRQVMKAYRPASEELQLTDAQKVLLQRHPQDYYLVRIAGRCFDAGSPAGYAAAQAAMLEGPAVVRAVARRDEVLDIDVDEIADRGKP